MARQRLGSCERQLQVCKVVRSVRLAGQSAWTKVSSDEKARESERVRERERASESGR